MATVRIHVNPAGSGKQTIVRVEHVGKNGKSVSFPSVAQARNLLLRNVRPVIEQGKGRKKPSTCLEGELVAWEGTFRARSNDAAKETLAPFKVSNLFNDAVHFQRILHCGPQLGYDAKKYPYFYEEPKGGSRISMNFVRAAYVAISGDSCRAEDAIFRAIDDNGNKTLPLHLRAPAIAA